MFTRNLFLFAAFLAGVAVLISHGQSKQDNSKEFDQPQGQNNTVLFLSNSEYGLANVLLATSHAMLVHHNDIKVHFASFQRRKQDIETISKFASNQSSNVTPITFHLLSGPAFGDALNSRGHFVADTIHEPGLVGNARLCNDIQKYLMPWSAAEYFNLYEQVSDIIEAVNPAVIVLDPQFGPGLDATRDKHRQYAIVSPNALRDNFAQLQPLGSMFWKYPAMASGFPYPVPLNLIPANIFMNLRFIYSVLVTPALREKKKYLKEKGLATPLNYLSVYNKNMVWISQSSPEADYPMPVIPDNVKPCGPIYLSTALAAKQDPELASWLNQAPTLLINLGSTTDYDEASATEMARAIKVLLEHTDVQVLWKFNRRKYKDAVADFSNDFLGSLTEVLGSRLRIENWIKIDPAAMMETGNIVASVHHGGGNCYHEAIGNGVPQVVLPLWADLYDYATRVEWLGVGVWGNKASAPNWTAEELSNAFLKVLGDDEVANSMRERAKQLGGLFQSKLGRVCAADELAKLARLRETQDS